MGDACRKQLFGYVAEPYILPAFMEVVCLYVVGYSFCVQSITVCGNKATEDQRILKLVQMRQLTFQSQTLSHTVSLIEENSLLEYGAAWSRKSRPTFQRCVLPASSGR